MAGGLVELSYCGLQDIFLTGSPQVTYFKIVYRRHTNFAIESKEQHFIGDSNFGQEISSIVSKCGDLMNQVYLEICLPKIDLIKKSTSYNIDKQTSKEQFILVEHYYKLVYNYITLNTVISRKIYNLLLTNNLSVLDIKQIISIDKHVQELNECRLSLQKYIESSLIFDKIDTFSTFSPDRVSLIQQLKTFDICILFNSIILKFENELSHMSGCVILDESLVKKQLFHVIKNTIYPQMKLFYTNVYDIFIEKQRIYNSFLNGTYIERYKFAWVEEIGHAIIDYVEIKIGNRIIDKHTGDWLILFNNLYLHEYQYANYHNMIGNVKELTIFDDKVKDMYRVIIPFQFWFCRHTGQSLPLVALRHNDITFTLGLKNLDKLCYVEDTDELPDIANIQSQFGINIVDAKLYVDYIYLGMSERKRFAESTHEYLIEIVQYNNFEIYGKSFRAHLDFKHPTKYICWFIQPKSYRKNPTGRNKCQWNNFSSIDNTNSPSCMQYGTKYPSMYHQKQLSSNANISSDPISSCKFQINSYNLTNSELDTKYLNCVQPYSYFNHTVPIGQYIYSYALNPMDHQPSCTINLSKIDDFSLFLDLEDDFVDKINGIGKYEILNDCYDNNCYGAHLGVYAMSYTILRFMSGMADVAFQ